MEESGCRGVFRTPLIICDETFLQKQLLAKTVKFLGPKYVSVLKRIQGQLLIRVVEKWEFKVSKY